MTEGQEKIAMIRKALIDSRQVYIQEGYGVDDLDRAITVFDQLTTFCRDRSEPEWTPEAGMQDRLRGVGAAMSNAKYSENYSWGPISTGLLPRSKSEFELGFKTAKNLGENKIKELIQIYKQPEYAYPNGCLLSQLVAKTCLREIEEISVNAEEKKP